MELYPVVWARLVSHLCLTVPVTAVSAHPRRFLRWVYRSRAVGSRLLMLPLRLCRWIPPCQPESLSLNPHRLGTISWWFGGQQLQYLGSRLLEESCIEEQNRTERIPTMQTVSLIAGLLRKAGHCSVVSQLVASGVVLAWSLQGPIMVTVSGQVVGHCSQLT